MAQTVRPFSWDDVRLLAALEAGSTLTESAPPAGSVERMRRWLAQPGMHPERDCFIALDGAAPSGYTYLVTEQPIGRGVLTGRAAPPGRQALLDAALSQARSAGLMVVDVDVDESDTERQAFLTSAGFTLVRTHVHLRRDDTRKVGAPVPEGATLRLAEPGDVPGLTALQNAAFTGSWGYSPNTPDEIAYRVFELPDDPPDHVLLLEQGGTLAAYCWTHREHADAPGVVGMVGVVPDQQSRGLGHAVTAAGLDHLIDVGATPVDVTVDSENAPALRVYERLGFTPRWRSNWYELAVSG